MRDALRSAGEHRVLSAISVAVESQFNLETYYDMGCGVTLPPDFAKCGGSRREVESAAKMAAVPARVWPLPRWWLSQSESRRDVLFRAR